MRDDPFPVEWAGRQAIVTFPGHLDISSVSELRDRLLAVINRGATVLIADMTGTASCDHGGVEAIARACQRAGINGTRVRLAVTAPVVRRGRAARGGGPGPPRRRAGPSWTTWSARSGTTRSRPAAATATARRR